MNEQWEETLEDLFSRLIISLLCAGAFLCIMLWTDVKLEWNSVAIGIIVGTILDAGRLLVRPILKKRRRA